MEQIPDESLVILEAVFKDDLFLLGGDSFDILGTKLRSLKRIFMTTN